MIGVSTATIPSDYIVPIVKSVESNVSPVVYYAIGYCVPKASSA